MAFKLNLNWYIFLCADTKKMTGLQTSVIGLRLIPNKDFPLDEWVELDGGDFVL